MATRAPSRTDEVKEEEEEDLLRLSLGGIYSTPAPAPSAEGSIGYVYGSSGAGSDDAAAILSAGGWSSSIYSSSSEVPVAEVTAPVARASLVPNCNSSGAAYASAAPVDQMAQTRPALRCRFARPGALPGVMLSSAELAGMLPNDGNGDAHIALHANVAITYSSTTDGNVSSLAAPPSDIRRPKEEPAAPQQKRQRSARRNGAPRANGGGALLERPPFPWATNQEGVHLSLQELRARGITAVEGEVQCKDCGSRQTISHNIEAKFAEVYEFILRNFAGMNDRAPDKWMNADFPDCGSCGKPKNLMPVVPSEKEKINWMFLLLRQELGHCTLEDLKHFCARTKQHRTGAKDRVLYSTYMELCRQLLPGEMMFNETAERQLSAQSGHPGLRASPGRPSRRRRRILTATYPALGRPCSPCFLLARSAPIDDSAAAAREKATRCRTQAAGEEARQVGAPSATRPRVVARSGPSPIPPCAHIRRNLKPELSRIWCLVAANHRRPPSWSSKSALPFLPPTV